MRVARLARSLATPFAPATALNAVAALAVVAALAAYGCSTSDDATRNDDTAGGGDGSPPNIVVVFLDDAGYGDFGHTGNPIIRTPSIDRMAAEGMRLTQFYSASPACTASRYSLLTGRLPVRSGFSWVLGPSSPRGIHPREWTLAEGLRDLGYATAIFGKWHLGLPEEYLPLQQGFDEYFGLPYSNDMQPPDWVSLPLFEGNDVIELDPDQTLLTEAFTRRALDFIGRNRQRPFFLYLPYSMPHLPLSPGAEFAGRSSRGAYGDVIEELDAAVGRIPSKLRQENLAERTAVFLTSDNGPWIIKNEEGGSSGPFRDGKGSTWEGGMRVPGVAWWPGTIPAGSIDRGVATTMDLYVTALALAGSRPPEDRRVDGRDISDRIRGIDADGSERGPSGPDQLVAEEPGEPLFFYGPGHALHAVRHGRWKLHVQTSSQTGIDYFGGTLPLLFDLEQDPGETWNLAERYPAVVAELRETLEAHRAEVLASGTFFDR